MKLFVYLSALSLTFAVHTAYAQSDAVTPRVQEGAKTAQQETSQATEPAQQSPKVEIIRHGDSAATIDEVRVGGETKSITVKPANNMPSYNIVPEQRNVPNNTGAGGQRVWKVINF